MRLLFILFGLTFIACTNSKSITKTATKSTVELKTSIQSTNDFPEDWAGTWQGDLEIFSKGKKTRTLPMKLIILPQGDSIQWTIQYDTMDTRPYTMKVLDKAQGAYLMDEHNSIKLETYLFGDKLISRYDVAGNQLIILEEKKGDQIIFEVIMAKDQPVSITGKPMQDVEEIPEVKTYPVKVYQKAILSRIKN